MTQKLFSLYSLSLEYLTLILTLNLFKGALAKIFVKKIFRLKVEERLWLNTNYCVRDEKYSRKHVNIFFFVFVSFREANEKDVNNANAAWTSDYNAQLEILPLNH